jgi:hypothetical protein
LCWYKKDDASIRNWPTAVSRCTSGAATDGDGSGGWYLPNLKELQYLYHTLGNNTSGAYYGNAAFFGGSSGAAALASALGYWSSTEYSATFAYLLTFINGTRDYSGKPNNRYVRCVRRF